MFLLMHIIHLVTVIVWIGGLVFVTGIILPMAIKTPDTFQKVLLFQRVEHRFAPLAKVYNIVTGVSGFTMVYMMGWEKLYFTKAGLPLTFMTGIWVFWFIMLIGLEPIVIKKMLENMLKQSDKMDVDAVFKKLNRLHWVMVAISIAASIAGALTAHGTQFF